MKTLIVNYPGLNIGGIECYFADLMRYALSKNYRVIWLTTKKSVQNSDFKDISNNGNIEKIFVGTGIYIFDDFKINFKKNEQITMLSCEPFNFVIGEKLKKYSNVSNFNNFLVLPHFTGSAYYPERFFCSLHLEKLFFLFFKKFANKIIENNSLMAFAEKHLNSYEDNYTIKILNKDEKILRSLTFQKIVLSEQELEEKAKYRYKNFEIISCTRFDFPHKGYILGLINAFDKLKKIYPQITLTIVGYGEGEQVIKNYINQLTPFSRQSIRMVGRLAPDELQKAYCRASLNVGLAGALIIGAKCGLPSLQVRHYTYDCECYGFYEDVIDKNFFTEHSMSIEPYIEKILKCSDNEYVQHGINAYKIARKNDIVDPEYVFRQTNISDKSIFSRMDFIVLRFVNILICGLIKILKIRPYEEKNA